MAKRDAIKTKKEDIVDYWRGKVYEGDLNFDWSDADIVCWNCGCRRFTERCHIVPHSLNGADSPENFVLMCRECHGEGPTCNSSQVMWDWIKSNRTNSGAEGSYWIAKVNEEYKRLYKKSYFTELLEVDTDPTTLLDEHDKWNKNILGNYTIHFGKDVTYNTRAGMIREFIVQMKKKYGEKNDVESSPIVEKFIGFRAR
jgi:HNH endonuclease